MKSTTPQPPRNYNATGNPITVSSKKSTSTADTELSNNVMNTTENIEEKSITNDKITVLCPDGSTKVLSPGTDEEKKTALNKLILGRGKYGIPPSASHVSRQACVLRQVIINNEHSLELGVLGSQLCRVTRGESVIFMKSLASILESSNGESHPSTITILDGDIIEPYNRPITCTIEDAMTHLSYHPFKVSINNGKSSTKENSDEDIDGSAFVEASKKLDSAASQACNVNQSVDKEDVGKDIKNEGKDKMEVDVADDTAKPDEATETTNMDKPTDKETQDFAQNIPDNESTKKETEKGASEEDQQPSAQSEKKSNANDGQMETNSGELDKVGKAKEAEDKAQGQAKVAEAEASSSSEESSEEDFVFDDARQEIIDILQAVESPGTFAVSGSNNGKLLMPGLQVDGIGLVGLPLSEHLAKEMIKRCEQAPFGRGEKTVIDKTVRNTFQLGPEHFQITNPTWKKEMESLTKQVCEGLGVDAHIKVEARLYKMLLYEKGSFFAPHRDSEKEPGMFATLVVVLPSHVTGGELVVKHRGETETFSQGSVSKFASQHAAFYADCKHELKPVESGHRLCLVYNLVKTGAGARPSANDNRAVLKRLKAAAQQWSEEYDDTKIVLMTDHLYTPAGIRNSTGSSKYKGGDAAIVQLLELAQEKGINIDYDHGTVSLSETGSGESDGYYGYGGGYSWNETHDRDLTLQLIEWGDVPISEEEEMIPEDYFEDQEPANESFEPTGNAGVEASRQYADAEAIVIWPRTERWKIVTRNTPSRMVDYLYKACDDNTPDSESKEECIKKATMILSRASDASSIMKLMKCVIKIDDKQLVTKFVSQFGGSLDVLLDQLQAFIDRFGADLVSPIILSSINTTRFVSDPTRMANCIIKYSKTLALNSANSQLTTSLLNKFVDVLCPADKSARSLSKNVDSFPLSAILDLFTGEHNSNPTMAKRVIEGYIWLSSQQYSGQSYRYSYSHTSNNVGKGPKLLLTIAPSLVDICEKAGWAEYETILLEATEKLSLGTASNALSFVEKLAPIGSAANTDRSKACERMASIVCEKILSSSSTSARTLETYKQLVKTIANYCPSFAARFTESAKQLDVDTILYPLVTDNVLQAAVGQSMKDCFNSLAFFTAQKLSSRVSTEQFGSVTSWSIPNTNMYQQSSFLRSPCKQVFDWKVRKTDHKGILLNLRPLINSREISAMSYQPGGRGAWHIKITKLKSRTVSAASLSSMTCDCSRYSYGYSHRSTSNCMLAQLKNRMSKYNSDNQKLGVVRALLNPDQQSQLTTNRSAPTSFASAAAASNNGLSFASISSGGASQPAAKKQKTSQVIDLLDDDDEVQCEGELSAAAAIRKRVKEAEDKGEVVEIN